MHNKDLPCLHFNKCSGCSIDTHLASPPLLLEAKEFFSQAGFSPLTVHTGSFKDWRCRAKLAVRGTFTSPKVGLYRAQSHDVVPIPHCYIHHPKINEAVALFVKWMQTYAVAPYDEIKGIGLIRYLQCVVERATGKVQLTLVINAKMVEPDFKRSINFLWEEGKEHLWHSLWVNFNEKRDNVIFGANWQHLFGQMFLWERLCGVDICFQPANFAQANLDLFERLIKSIKENVPQGAKVTELYAGVGAIGLAIAERCQHVRCSDINPNGHLCFEKSKQRLAQPVAERISWRQGKAAELGSELIEADVAIVDPPRSGIGEALRSTINLALSVQKLVYVSCGWKAFMKDCALLIEEGWLLEKAEVYLLFPGSNHIETLAFFKRIH